MNRPILSILLLAAPAIAQTVTVDWLLKMQREDPALVILDARPEADYAKGHIPGALPINTWDFLIDSAPAGEAPFHQWLTDTFGKLGLTPGDRLVVYEDRLGIRASRAFWLLWYAGQTKVGMLEGGLEAWRAAGRPVVTDPTPPRSASRYKLRPQKKWLSTARDVAAVSQDRKTVILDVRARDEFDGKSGNTDCARQGAIPGAVWVEWTDFLEADRKTLRRPEGIGLMLIEKGITPDKQIITYCHRGARSAMVWAALDNLGYPKVKNYAGSWHDWASK